MTRVRERRPEHRIQAQTMNNYRDGLFVGSTYGPDGITVAVRLGFDDNCSLGGKETGGKAALPVFREVMLKTYQAKLVGPVPSFSRKHGKQHCRISERQLCGKRSDAVLQIAGCRRSRRGANEILPRCRQDAGNERLRASGHHCLSFTSAEMGVARPFLRTSEERLPEARQQLRAESSAPWSVPHQPSLPLRRLRPHYYCLRLTRGCKEGQRAKIEVVRPPRGVNSPRTTHHSGRTAATMSWRILFTAFS